jgi:excisionase family DNA binding protein
MAENGRMSKHMPQAALNRDQRRYAHQLHDYDTAAAFLHCSPRLVRKLVQERRLASVKVGSLVRIEESALEDFVGRQRREAVR